MPDRESVINGLAELKETIRTAKPNSFVSGGFCAMNMKRLDNAIALINTQHKLILELQNLISTGTKMIKGGEVGMKVYRKLIRPVHCYPGQGYEPKTELVEKEEKWYPEEEREHLEEKYGYLNEGHFSDLIFEEKYEPCLLNEQEAEKKCCRDCEYYGACHDE